MYCSHDVGLVLLLLLLNASAVLSELARREAELHLAAEAGKMILQHNQELVRRHAQLQQQVTTAHAVRCVSSLRGVHG